MLPTRKPNAAYWLQLVTLGFYFFYWCARAGGEANRALGRKLVPSAWWFLVPAYGAYWWTWQYGKALDELSGRRIKAADTFLLYIIISNIWLIGPFVNLHGSGVNERLVIIILVASVIAFTFIQILSHAFFCAVIQGKINKLKSTG